MWQSPCGAGSLQGKEVCGIIKSQEAQRHTKKQGAFPIQEKKILKKNLSSSVMEIMILQ